MGLQAANRRFRRFILMIFLFSMFCSMVIFDEMLRNDLKLYNAVVDEPSNESHQVNSKNTFSDMDR